MKWDLKQTSLLHPSYSKPRALGKLWCSQRYRGRGHMTTWPDVEETSQGCVTAEQEQLRNERLGHVEAFEHVYCMCVWEGTPVCPSLSVLYITLWKIHTEDACSPVCENWMWSGLMPLSDFSSLAYDLWLSSSDLHSQGQTVWSPSGRDGWPFTSDAGPARYILAIRHSRLPL